MAILPNILRRSERKDSSWDAHSLAHFSLTPSVSHSVSSTRIARSASGQKDCDFALVIQLESPPVVFYGYPPDSSGSILSGLLRLNVGSSGHPSSPQGLRPVLSAPTLGDFTAQDLILDSVTLSLVQTIRYSKAFLLNSSACHNCSNCHLQETVLAQWNVLTTRSSFAHGTHAYPFSHLLPGTLPQSCKIGQSLNGTFIKYHLAAVANTASGKTKSVEIPINVARLIIRGPDHNSLRVFPPTEITSNVVLPNVVYPKLSFAAEFKLENVVSAKKTRRWRLRKFSWRIEETARIRVHTCSKHTHKLEHARSSQLRQDVANALPPIRPGGLHHTTVHTRMALMPNHLPHQASGQSHLDLAPHPDQREGDLAEHPDSGPGLPTPPEPDHEELMPIMSGASTNAILPVESAPAPESRPASDASDDEKHLFIEETRTVSHGEIKLGWKSDFSDHGTIELVANISLVHLSTGFFTHVAQKSSTDNTAHDSINGLRRGANVSCDIDDPTLGVFVNHNLVVEVVVAEEVTHAVDRNAQSQDKGSVALTGVPTGAARVLRMQFKLVLTERSGLGIAWDDEVPPTYNDVRTLSPPVYAAGTPIMTPSAETPMAMTPQAPFTPLASVALSIDNLLL